MVFSDLLQTRDNADIQIALLGPSVGEKKINKPTTGFPNGGLLLPPLRQPTVARQFDDSADCHFRSCPLPPDELALHTADSAKGRGASFLPNTASSAPSPTSNFFFGRGSILSATSLVAMYTLSTERYIAVHIESVTASCFQSVELLACTVHTLPNWF